MNNKVPTNLLLPPDYISSKKFTNKIIKSLNSNLDNLDDIDYKGYKEDIWFKAIRKNKLWYNLPSKNLPKFCKSVKGIFKDDYYGKTKEIAYSKRLEEELFEIALYLEGIPNLPKTFFEKDFCVDMVLKYNYRQSPAISHNSQWYTLLTDYFY